MHWQEHVERIVGRVRREPFIEGAFLGGSLVTGKWDEFSDVDLGIVTANNTNALQQAFALRDEIASLVGEPAHRLERRWEHSVMIALVYGRTQFPPIGFELDVFFGQLQYVAELMPGRHFTTLFDRTGELARALDRLSRERREGEVRSELLEQLEAFPFDANHAIKALARDDLFNYQNVLERMRAAILSAAASREGSVIRASKRASRYLAPAEREIVRRSYLEFTPQAVRQLVDLYVRLVHEVQGQYGLEAEVDRLRRALPEVLPAVPLPVGA